MCMRVHMHVCVFETIHTGTCTLRGSISTWGSHPERLTQVEGGHWTSLQPQIGFEFFFLIIFPLYFSFTKASLPLAKAPQGTVSFHKRCWSRYNMAIFLTLKSKQLSPKRSFNKQNTPLLLPGWGVTNAFHPHYCWIWPNLINYGQAMWADAFSCPAVKK